MPITPKNKPADIGSDVVLEDIGGNPGLPGVDASQLTGITPVQVGADPAGAGAVAVAAHEATQDPHLAFVGDTGAGGQGGAVPAPPAGSAPHRFQNADGTWRIVDQIDLWVRKGSPGAIAKGAPVYISGYNPGQGVFEVEEARANAAGTMPAIGLAAQPITNSANAMLTHNGKLENVDTSAWTASDDLYVSAAAAGALQNTRPTGGTSQIQKIGEVLRPHATLGVIQVYGAGRSNAAPNIPFEQAFVGDANAHPQPVNMLPISLMPAILVADVVVKKAKTGEDWAVAVPPAGLDDPVTGPPVAVYSFHETIEQGVGIEMPVLVPSNATQLTVFMPIAAALAPPGTRSVGFKFYAKPHPNNAARGGSGLGWTAGTQLPDGIIPANVNEQYYQQTVTLASVGVNPGELMRWELTRVAPLAGNNLPSFLNINESGIYVRLH